jgi:uncharacterized membrane protein
MQSQQMERTRRRIASHSSIDFEESLTYETSAMAKVVAILSYITLIGWLAAIVLYGRHKSNYASFHLRQSLGLIITGALLLLIPLIGWLLNLIVCLAWLYAIYHVVQGHKQKVPLLGDFYQEHLDFIK